VGESPAVNATPSQKELVSSAVHLQQKVKANAGSTEEHQLVPRQIKADSVAARLKPFTATKRAEREPNELRACVGFVR
jgi:hypothetical protein